MIKVKVKRVCEGAIIPRQATPGAAGFDISAAESVLIMRNGGRATVSTGLSFEIPPGFELQIRPRSGLAAKKGITVLNSPGTVDSDYRGEVKVILVNTGSTDVMINKGSRIAQGVVGHVPQVEFVDVGSDELSNTSRGSGGFGSTGN